MKQSLVMLAHEYNAKCFVRGWLWSYKLDGMRALWVPSTRGVRVADVPFANRDKDSRDDVCTGLWSRRGKIIFAPNEFLNALPASQAVDGELWCPGGFETLIGVARRRSENSVSWDKVTYRVFEMPEEHVVFTPRVLEWATNFVGSPFGITKRFRDKLEKIYELCNKVIVPLEQRPVVDVEEHLQASLAAGHEGIMLRDPDSYYVTQRSRKLLKYKPFSDAEGVCTGTYTGEGKYAGMLGGLVVEWNGKSFRLGGGFTDAERMMPMASWIGKVITFKYRILTDAGVPREGRFWRIRDE